MSTTFISPEVHPLPPFLPRDARLLMLGSFPPPRKRWCMDFFYPNFINDMWRIFGWVFFADKNRFVDEKRKCFRQADLEAFLTQTGIALYDTATVVKRLQENASDKFLEVVEPTDVGLLLRQLPQCRAVAVTGQKATDTLLTLLDVEEPPVGGSTPFAFTDREAMRLYRMPSSSRAYPMRLEQKAEAYRRMMHEVGLLP